MDSKNYRSRTFLLILVLTMIAIIIYQEPAHYQQAYYAKELIEDSALNKTVLAEMKLIKLVLEQVVLVLR